MKKFRVRRYTRYWAKSDPEVDVYVDDHSVSVHLTKRDVKRVESLFKEIIKEKLNIVEC